jgi:hypothetical protein
MLNFASTARIEISHIACTVNLLVTVFVVSKNMIVINNQIIKISQWNYDVCGHSLHNNKSLNAHST